MIDNTYLITFLSLAYFIKDEGLHLSPFSSKGHGFILMNKTLLRILVDVDYSGKFWLTITKANVFTGASLMLMVQIF